MNVSYLQLPLVTHS